MKKLFFLFFIAGAMASCDKFLDTKQEGQISDLDEFITSKEQAELVLNGAYDVMANVFDGDIQNLAELISSNAALPNNNDLKAVWDRETTFFNNTINGIYTDMYRTVFRANLVIEYAERQGGNDPDMQRMIAECKFLRALSHFYILKVYAQPWGYSADNSHLGIVLRLNPSQDPLARSTVAESMAAIQSDLLDARAGLPEDNYIYANKYAASALLAYTYYLQNNYDQCITYCDEVINSGNYVLESTVDVFLAQNDTDLVYDSSEGIFFAHSTPSVGDGRNDGFRNNYLPGSSPTALSLSAEFYQFMTLNAQDLRYTELVSNNTQQGQVHSLRFGKKDQNNPFFSVPVLRLSVLHLIRAESKAELGTDLEGAIADLNLLRDRAFNAPNPVPSGISASDLIEVAQEEFRKETFCEGLWIDVERRNGARGQNVTIRNAPWNCDGMAIQFPNSEGTGAGFIFNPEGGCN